MIHLVYFVDTEVTFVKSRDSPVSATEESLGTKVHVWEVLPKMLWFISACLY